MKNLDPIYIFFGVWGIILIALLIFWACTSKSQSEKGTEEKEELPMMLCGSHSWGCCFYNGGECNFDGHCKSKFPKSAI